MGWLSSPSRRPSMKPTRFFAQPGRRSTACTPALNQKDRSPKARGPQPGAEIMQRIYILGAVYLERRRWSDARALASQRVDFGIVPNEDAWARHAFAELVHAGLNEKRRGLVQYAMGWLRQQPWFLVAFGDDESRALSHLCKFDYVQ